jgi:hypothetical protein
MRELSPTENYNNGAITALSFMAEMGVSKSDVYAVAELMDLVIDESIYDSDKERFIAAYGDLNPPGNVGVKV